MRSIFSLVIVFGLACTQSFAQTVTYTLEYTVSSNTFEVFAEASLGDNFGLSTYGIPLTGSLSTLSHVSPFASLANADFTGLDSSGYSEFRSADDVFLVVAAQDTISPTLYLVPGLAQSASSFAAEFPSQNIFGIALGDPWSAKLLIATGTFTGDGSDLGFNTGSGSFTAAIFSVADLSLVTPPNELLTVVTECVTACGGNGNTPPNVTDLFGSDPFDQHTLATNPNPASYQMLGTDAEDVDATLDWTAGAFTGPFHLAGGTLPGSGNGFQTLSSSGLFEWDPTGSARGFYFQEVTVTDSGGLTDTGILRVQVPEPSTLILAGLSLVGVFASRRYKS